MKKNISNLWMLEIVELFQQERILFQLYGPRSHIMTLLSKLFQYYNSKKFYTRKSFQNFNGMEHDMREFCAAIYNEMRGGRMRKCENLGFF